MKRALIIDLDNTVYPVKSISDKLFAPLLQLIHEHRGEISDEDYEKAREELMRRPFQKVAESCHFSGKLTERGRALLRDTTYDGPMRPFADYQVLKELPLDKFLVTTGFLKLQNSKIEQLGIRSDFKEIHIVDPEVTDKTKKEIFEEIMHRHGFSAKDLLVVGDDPESEISAAKRLGIETFLYDPENKYTEDAADFKGASMEDLSHVPGLLGCGTRAPGAWSSSGE